MARTTLLVLALAAGCASPTVTSQPLGDRTAPATPPTPAAAAASTPRPSGDAARRESPMGSETPSPGAAAAVGEPARPFDVTAILSAMRDSRRPGGVPTQLQTHAIAAAVADAIWTADGRPWATMSIGGSCGPQRCTLEVGGRHRDSLGDDLWILGVTPAEERVEVLTADLRSLPANVADELDRVARDAGTEVGLDDLVLTSVRWLPPPRAGSFVLAYRTGNEERSCAVDLTIDAVTGTVEEEAVSSC